MVSSCNFWKALVAFTILFVCQSVFIANFWSNQWFVADNVVGRGSMTYTLLIGFNSNCIKSNNNVKPHCTSLSDSGDFFKNYGIEFPINTRLLTLMYVGKFFYYFIIVLHLVMTVAIIGVCQNFDSSKASASDILFTSASSTDLITKITFSVLLLSGYGYEIGITINGDKVYSTFGFALVIFMASLVVTTIVDILMLHSFIKTGKEYVCSRGETYRIVRGGVSVEPK